ncbi:LamB/YcsF family protein [Rhizobium sp. TRM95111]|uniref:LamB/YcsF family protein n=1 Tax=Rhizobium alarense TaxID=2846851 RepID=UPI001F2EF077|nr:5-oxoprolinase subunit PxpA [Rhizobium alarense]MCF3640340.1 LamB/YcsF family protein [Rhizobium alarense]
MRIDINADLGEGFGPYSIADDEALMPLITSANIACGYHAGDPMIMDRTVRLAKENGVDIGAHVSFPDRMGFGRRVIQMDASEIEKHVLYQLGALDAFARATGQRIWHVNPHGALGNLASADAKTAEALVSAVRQFDPEIRLLVLPGSALEKAAKEAGLPCWRLFLVDRAYTKDGQLAPRSLPGAVIKDEAAVLARLLKLLREHVVETIDGETIDMPAHSILVHSDTPGAVALARTIRKALEQSGTSIVPLSAQV